MLLMMKAMDQLAIECKSRFSSSLQSLLMGVIGIPVCVVPSLDIPNWLLDARGAIFCCAPLWGNFLHPEHVCLCDIVMELLVGCKDADKDGGHHNIRPEEPCLQLVQCWGLDSEWKARA